MRRSTLATVEQHRTLTLYDLFANADGAAPQAEILAPGAVLLRGKALPLDDALLQALDEVIGHAPFRHMQTPGGFVMSVAMSNCGTAGWVSDRRGYRYAHIDPDSGRPWPEMPEVFMRLATGAALDAGYAGFVPDSCLINRYVPGSRLTLHQDRNERDLSQPVVSVSLGLPARFQFGGLQRTDPVRACALQHGDVVVWGGPARLHHHGVLALKPGLHPRLGSLRINLSFRRAL